MKIGVITDCFNKPHADGIKMAAELGLDGVQIYATSGDFSPETLDEAAKAEYPNAYKPWEEEEDNALRDFVAEQLSFDEIADHFQRKRGAIISRIKHLKIDKE